MIAGFSKGFSELLYVRVHSPVIAFKIRAPGNIEDLVTREHNVFVIDKHKQQIVFFRRQINGLSVYAYKMPCRVY